MESQLPHASQVALTGFVIFPRGRESGCGHLYFIDVILRRHRCGCGKYPEEQMTPAQRALNVKLKLGIPFAFKHL